MQSSSNAEEAKTYFAILIFVLFDDNSMCLAKIGRLGSSWTICNYLQLFTIIRKE